MSPASIGPVKAMTLALDAGKVTRRLDALLGDELGEDDVRSALIAFAEVEGIPL